MSLRIQTCNCYDCTATCPRCSPASCIPSAQPHTLRTRNHIPARPKNTASATYYAMKTLPRWTCVILVPYPVCKCRVDNISMPSACASGFPGARLFAPYASAGLTARAYAVHLRLGCARRRMLIPVLGCQPVSAATCAVSD